MIGEELVETKDGVVPYRWAERVAIAMESGMSEAEAKAEADKELTYPA